MNEEHERKKQSREQGKKRKREKDQDGDELPFFTLLTRSLRSYGFEMVSHEAVATFNLVPWQ